MVYVGERHMGTIKRESKPGSSRRKGLTPEQRRRRKVIQIFLGMAMLAIIMLLAAIAQNQNPKGAYILLIGTALGYVLQRSRFCFTAALRDPLLTGGTILAKALIIALAVSTFLFMALNIQKFGFGLENYGYVAATGFVQKVGLHTAIGAFLFGMGAVIAGGCASGTLMRMGEGFLQQWIVIIFFIIGSVFGGFAAKVLVFESTKAIFLPDLLGGWIPAFIVQFLLLVVLYVLADMWGKKKSGGV